MPRPIRTLCSLLGGVLLGSLPLACQSPWNANAGDWPSESERLQRFFEEVYEEDLQADPERLTYLGRKDRAGEWTDRSEGARERTAQRVRGHLQRLHDEFSYAALNPEDQLNYRLFESVCERRLAQHRWRWQRFPVHQMRGDHRAGLGLLLNAHQVKTPRDAEAYVERLEGMGTMLQQVTDRVLAHESHGVLPPQFVYDKVLQDCRNAISGAPLGESSQDNPIWADLVQKLDGLEDLTPRSKRSWLQRAETALRTQVVPNYKVLMAVLIDQRDRALDNHGAWSLPDGEDFYQSQLRYHTTTDWDADQIHALGLEEVRRIQGEMTALQQQVGWEGSLQEFFAHLRQAPEFFYPNTEEGRARYLAEATGWIDNMRERLPEVFATLPAAPLEVRAVEPFRERSAGKAFYQGPAADGSRPGVYYANLYDMADMPIYQMEALAYHEGIPGHHMQIAIAQELEGLPSFRRFGHYTAYAEGWGLYSEWLPKEMGLYADPYSDLGRLAMELWRAARLVVDTGMHHKRWTREQAIAYLMENTPNPEGDCIKAIERYLVMPGQATAYKVGMLRMQALRSEAEAQLGDAFDLRAFHDVLLRTGPVPLDILAEQVQAWVREVLEAQASRGGALRD